MRFNMLFTICPTDMVQQVVEAAKTSGATGATILNVRGTGHKEAKTFFGLTLDRPQEAVVMIVESHKRDEIMAAIYNAGQMEKPGNGICFSMKIDTIVGLESQMNILKKEAEEYI